MEALTPASLQCPYCWETLELLVDCSATSQSYVEDCGVCCNPILVIAEFDEDGGLRVEARREND